jgi:predicted MFS family arabinose efflux permease
VLATLRERNFALLWVAGLISYTGDWLLIAALPVFLFERTGSVVASGLIWLVYPLAGFLVGPVAGVFVDRWDRRQTMVAGNLLQAALLPVMLLGMRDDALWILYVVAFVEGALLTFMFSAEGALLPRLVGEERLVTANALNALNDNLARIAGPAIGALLVARTGLTGAIVVDAITYLAAALLLSLLALPEGARAVVADGAVPDAVASAGIGAVWREWREGLRVIRSVPTLPLLIVVVATAVFGDSLGTAMIAPFVLEVVAGGAAFFGVVLAMRGVAGLLGGIVVSRFGQGIAPERLLGWSLIVAGILLLLFINIRVVPVMLAVQLLLGPAIAGWFASQQTLLQTAVADQYRGRLLGTAGALISLTGIVGIGLASGLGERIGIVPVFNASAVLYAVAGGLVLLLLQPASAAEPAPASPAIALAGDGDPASRRSSHTSS